MTPGLVASAPSSDFVLRLLGDWLIAIFSALCSTLSERNQGICG
jgi:hypothetical protein